MDRPQVAWGALIIGLALLVYSFVPGYGPQETWFQGTQAVLADPDMSITAVNWHPYESLDSAGKPLAFTASAADQTVSVDLTGLPKNWYTLELVHGQKSTFLELQVLDKKYGFMAALGALLVILAAPEFLIRKSRLVWLSGKRQVPVTGWTYLLMEPSGLSLARLQLVILFLPAAAVYLALSFPLHQFPPMPDTIWQMLGLGGASAALSTLITPDGRTKKATESAPNREALPATVPAAGQDPSTAATQAPAEIAAAVMATLAQQGTGMQDLSSDAGRAAAAPTQLIIVRRPSTTDLFEEVNGFGDMSRYQSLVICVATAVTFFVSFFDTWSVPAIPVKVLQLLGTSLAVYLGVKGIKQVKNGNTTETPS